MPSAVIESWPAGALVSSPSRALKNRARLLFLTGLGRSADPAVPVGDQGRAVDLLSSVRALGTPSGPDGRRRDPLKVSGIVLLLAAGADVLLAAVDGGSWWPQPVVLPIGLAALLWPVARRPAWLTVTVHTAVPAVFSGAVTAAVFWSGQEALSGPGELAILLCLLLVAVRDSPCGGRRCAVFWTVRPPELTGTCACWTNAAAWRSPRPSGPNASPWRPTCTTSWPITSPGSWCSRRWRPCAGGGGARRRPWRHSAAAHRARRRAPYGTPSRPPGLGSHGDPADGEDVVVSA